MRPPRLLVLAAIALVVGLGFALTVGADYFAVRNGVDEILDPAGRAAARDDARRTLLQAGAGIAVLVAGFFTYWRIRLSEHEQVTERFSKAIEQLGSTQLAVRIGAIAALERIAKDSHVDRGAISEILCAVVRESTPAVDGDETSPLDFPADKLQACLVLGRTLETARFSRLWRRRSTWRIALPNTDLRHADLSGLNFSSADLRGSDLSHADLSSTRLDNAILVGAILSSASCDGARARGADLSGALIANTSMVSADLSLAKIQGGTVLRHVNLQGSKLDRAQGDSQLTLEECNLTGASMRRAWLRGSVLSEVEMVDTDAREADLSAATLNNVNLTRSDLRSVRMIETSLSEVVFRSARIAGLETSLQPADRQELERDASIGSSRQTGVRLAVKRAIDISVALFGLVVMAPILMLVALSIKVDDRGPILFGQDRVGSGGRVFRVLKFRTMYGGTERFPALDDVESNEGPLFKLSRDPRVTTVGRVLRRTSLDELPQLLNVVRGDMSLVGPRPSLPGDAARFGEFGETRTAVLPGITGLWQLRATDFGSSLDDSLRIDAEYVRRWTIGLDLRILGKTLVSAFRRRDS